MKINTVPRGVSNSPDNTQMIPFIYKGKKYYKYGGKILAAGGNPDDPNINPMSVLGYNTTGQDLPIELEYGKTPYTDSVTGSSFGMNDIAGITSNLSKGLNKYNKTGNTEDLTSGLISGALNTTPIGSLIGTAASLVSGVGEAATIGNKVVSPYGDYYKNNYAAGIKGVTDPIGEWSKALGNIGKEESLGEVGLTAMDLFMPGAGSWITEGIRNKEAKKESKRLEEEARIKMYNEGREAKRPIDEQTARHNYSTISGFYPYGGKIGNTSTIIDTPIYDPHNSYQYRNLSIPEAIHNTDVEKVSDLRLKSSIGSMSSAAQIATPATGGVWRSAPGSSINRISINKPGSNYLLANGGISGNNLPNRNSVQIDENAELVTNDEGGVDGSHEQGDNVPVYNKSGNPTAQVEPGEVVVDLPNGSKFALSKRLGTAQMYMDLVNTKNELNSKLQSTSDTFKRNSIKREIDGIDSKLNEIPKLQEQMKAQSGMENDQDQLGNISDIEEFAFGGKINELPNGIKILANAGFTSDPPFGEPINPELLTPYEEQMRANGIDADWLSQEFEDYKIGRRNPKIEDYLAMEFENYPATYPSSQANVKRTPVPKGEYRNRNIGGLYRDEQGNLRGAFVPKGRETTLMPSVMEYEYGYSDINGGKGGYDPSTNELFTGIDKEKRKRGTGINGINGIGTNTINSIINNAGEFLPMLDNIINAQLANKYPIPEPPEQYTYRPVNTKYDIGAQEADVLGQAKDLVRYSRLNSPDIQTAIANASAINRGTYAPISQMYQTKGNIERQLEGQNTQEFNRINAANVDMRNEYYDMLDKIQAGKIQDISRNAANLQDDFTSLLTRRDMKDYQKKQLIADMVQNSDTNSWLGLAQNPEFASLFAGSNSKEQWKTIRDNAAKTGTNQMLVDWIDKNVFKTK